MASGLISRQTDTAHWLEWQNWADPVLQQPYNIKGGMLDVPDVSGVGLEWNEDAVRLNQVEI